MMGFFLRIGLTASLALLLAVPIAEAASISAWGGAGSSPGQFSLVGGLAVGPNGDVFASDLDPGENSIARIQEFTGEGAFVRQWGAPGSGPGQMNRPLGLAVDPSGNVYVADYGNHRIDVFGPSGAFVRMFGSFGHDAEHLAFPSGVGIGAGGTTFVADEQGQIHVFNGSGAFVGAWGEPGSMNGQLHGRITGMGIAGGRIFLPDGFNQRVQRFDEVGGYQLQWLVSGAGSDAPTAVAADAQGNVFVPVSGNRILKYDSIGTALGSVSLPGFVEAVAVGPSGLVYASNGQRTVYRIDPSEPTAKLAAAPGLILTGAPLRLDATASWVPFSAPSRYEWDLGSGTFGSAAGPTLDATFSVRGVRTVRVRVTAPGGKTDVAAAVVDVRPAPPAGRIGVSIDDGDYATNRRRVSIDAVWPANALRALLSNDGGFGQSGQAEERDLDTEMPWRLRGGGTERLPRTVYIRFVGAGQDTATLSDDIVLDTTTPSVESASLEGEAGSDAAERAGPGRVYRVRVAASARLSGVAAVALSARRGGGEVVRLVDRRRPGIRRLRRTVSARLKVTPRFVRVRNAAGTWSQWHPIGG